MLFGVVIGFCGKGAGRISLNVVADTWVGQDTPGMNHDGVNDLECGMDTVYGKSREVYLKFNIGSIPADFGTIHLNLKACIKQNEGWVGVPALDFEIYGTSSDWEEASLTWENKPAVNPQLLGTFTIVQETQDYTVNGYSAMAAYIADLKSAGINQVSFVIRARKNTPGSRIWISSSGWIGSRLTILEAEFQPPGFISTYPRISRLGSSSIDFEINLDKPGTVYYMEKEQGSTAPSVNDLLNGHILHLPVTSQSEMARISGLQPETSYEVYFITSDFKATRPFSILRKNCRLQPLNLTWPPLFFLQDSRG